MNRHCERKVHLLNARSASFHFAERSEAIPSPCRAGFFKRTPFFLLVFPLIFLFAAGGTQPTSIWVANIKMTLFSPYLSNPIHSGGKFYRSGSKIRYEPTGSEEIDLYDLQRLVEIRLFTKDRIYFETRLTPARLLKALREGWLSPPEPIRERRILLRTGEITGRTARLYLVLLEESGRRWHSLRWVTADDAELPIRVIYPASDYETAVIDYDPLPMEPADPALFLPPPGFLSVNPY
ncbi:MAG: hypothetical protein WAO55_03270 [Candidatus Manganitrophaceae bacterium]